MGIRVGTKMGFHSFVSKDATIGLDVEIGHGVTIETGVVIGDNVQVWSNSYIGHDCVLEDDVVICPSVALAGHTRVMKGAYVGINSCTHQFVTIGPYACVGAGAVVLRDVVPGTIVVGVPAGHSGSNVVGLARAGHVAVPTEDTKEFYKYTWRRPK